jgi:hypothetical protein
VHLGTRLACMATGRFVVAVALRLAVLSAWSSSASLLFITPVCGCGAGSRKMKGRQSYERNRRVQRVCRSQLGTAAASALEEKFNFVNQSFA